MRQCSKCNKHFSPDEDYQMSHCGGAYENTCGNCYDQQEESSMDIYQENGFEDREDYLQCLADEYDTSLEHVYALAELFGPTEDFDGLVTALDQF